MTIHTDAQDDIDEYIDTIIYTYDAPMTAKKYRDALLETLKKIAKYPESYTVRYTLSLHQFGVNVHRVVAASMITGL